MLFEDFRHAVRMLWKSPGVTALAVLTLALGIGANTAIFSMVDVVLFRPLPATRPNELVRVADDGGGKNVAPKWPFTSFPRYLIYRDRSDVFSNLAAYVDRFPVNLAAPGASGDRVDAGMVTGNYFETLGVPAYLGRTITRQDDVAGGAPVAMLSYDYWRNHCPAGKSALGSAVLIDGQFFTVVGITAPGFGGISFENLPEVWLPMSQAFQVDPLLKSEIPHQDEAFAPFGVVGRLKPGISLNRAQAQLEILAAQAGAGEPDPRHGSDGFKRPWPVLLPAARAARDTGTNFAVLVMAIVLLVLLTACGDVSGLLLARCESRQKEIAVRLALGAPRSRIISLQVMEGLLVSALGALGGCLLAACVARAIVATSVFSILPIPLERAASVLDSRVLVFAAVMSLVAGVMSSLAPAIRYSRLELALMIQGETRTVQAGGRRLSWQSLLVVGQIASSVILLAGAGLMLRTLSQVSRIHLGFDPDHAVAISTDPIRQGYTKNAAAALLNPLVDAVRAQPGVESAAIGGRPLQGGANTVVVMEGRESGSGDWVQLMGVTPGYFTTLGIPLLRGRDFRRADDHEHAGLAIINQAVAQGFWPNQNPIGKRIEKVGPQDETLEIIGVAGNVAPANLRGKPVPTVYLPMAQRYLMFPWQPDVTLIARTSGNPKAIVPAMRAAVASVDSGLPAFGARTMQEQIATTFPEDRFLQWLLLAAAILATVLSAAGVYGLVSYASERATREFGVRLALGAQRSNILWLVLRRGVVLGTFGVVLGTGTALMLTKFLRSLLYEVSPMDPLTFSAAGVMMFLLCIIACYVPARRATESDPMVALRSE